MIDGKTKHKLLTELEKTGNVYLACTKLGIHRSTLYRWKQDDKDISKRIDKAMRLGRENMCDIAEHALLLNVKEKRMDAIKYVLSNNSPRYRRKKDSKVILEHRSSIPLKDPEKEKTFEDVVDVTLAAFRKMHGEDKKTP